MSDVKRLEDKVDKLAEDMVDIKVILERNTASLEEHMRRSDALETYVKQVDNHVKENVIKDEIEPIKKHVNQVTWAIRGIFWFCATAASIALALKQLGIIK